MSWLQGYQRRVNGDSGVHDLANQEEPNTEGASASAEGNNPEVAQAGTGAEASATLNQKEGSGSDNESDRSSLFEFAESSDSEDEMGKDITLPPYTGYKKGTQYQGPTGQMTECRDAHEYVLAVERAVAPAHLSDEDIMSRVIQVLVPGSPVAQWHRMKEMEGAIKGWEDLKTGILDAYGLQMSAYERVQLIHRNQQGKQESGFDFMVRMKLLVSKFAQSQEHIWKRPEFVAMTAEQKAGRVKGLEASYEDLLTVLFLSGINTEVFKEIDRQDTTALSEMLKIAKKYEQHQTAKASHGRVAAVGIANDDDIRVDTEEERRKAENDRVDARVAALLRQAGISAGAKPDGTAQVAAVKEGKKKKKKDLATTSCFYCLAKGHFANMCKVRQADRQGGIFRPTMKCQPMTQEEFSALPHDEKNKGRNLVGRQATAATPTVNSVQATSHQQPRSMEEDFAGYYGAKN